MTPEVFVAIMAGGRGERFWPLSRSKRPKQFLKLFGTATLIEQTVLRLRNMVASDHILVITNESYKAETARLLPELPPANIICEPCAKNTAPCVALAAGIVKAKASTADPVLIMLPADHFISNSSAMCSDLERAISAGLKYRKLLTIGIPPTFPSTEYGYIQCGKSFDDGTFEVEKFLEKPSREKAQALIATGNFRWNAGMFVLPLPVLLNEFDRHAPALLALAQNIAGAYNTPDFNTVLADEFNRSEKISIDFALMEKSSAIMLLPASFDWEDVGNWNAIKKYLPVDEAQNCINGNVSLLDCENCLVYTDNADMPKKQLIAGIGLKDMLIVQTADAVLVAPEKELTKLRTLLEQLRQDGENGDLV